MTIKAQTIWRHISHACKLNTQKAVQPTSYFCSASPNFNILKLYSFPFLMFKFYWVSILFMTASYASRWQKLYFIYEIEIGSKSELTGRKAFTLGIFSIWALINVTLMSCIILAYTSWGWKCDISGRWILIFLPLFLPSLLILKTTTSSRIE